MTLSKWNLENKMSNLLRLVAYLLLTNTMLFSVMSWAVIPEQKVLDIQSLNNSGPDVSVDGDTALIGSPSADDDYAGEVHVYVRSNGVWVEQQKLTASDASWGNGFGSSVSISGDTALIGAPQDIINGYFTGSVYIFVRSNGVWTEQQKLSPSNDDAFSYLEFGHRVSIDDDTAVIGGGYSSSAAYVYIRSNGEWTEQQKLPVGSNSISVSGDTAVIGRYDYNDPGSAYVYVRNNGEWTEQQKLTASDHRSGDQFGTSVSIDGDMALIGAPSGDRAGSAYVYVRNDGEWSEQQKLSPSDDVPYDFFGHGVSVSGDTAVITNLYWTYVPAALGSRELVSAYVFTRSSRSNWAWVEQQKITASDYPYGDVFGHNVSISGDTALIGAESLNPEYRLDASAYFLDLTSLTDDPAVITGDTSATINFGNSTTGRLVATDSDGLTDGTYFSLATPPLYGTAGINTASGFWFYFAPPAFIGEDPFTVTVTDDKGYMEEQIISITTINPDDLDNDGVNNDGDAFPNDPAEWIDTDADMVGDNADNCTNDANTDQANLDSDAFGDACDNDIDGDGTENAFDTFPNDASETTDTDFDTKGDNIDNCVNNVNTDQANLDGDALGDVCDPDMDGDGVANDRD